MSLSKISEEFHRITSKDLLGTFNASLDKFGPGLLKIYRSKKGAFGQEMDDLLDQLDDQTSDIVSHQKTAALRGLPIYLRGDATKFFLKCLDTDTLGIIIIYMFSKPSVDVKYSAWRKIHPKCY